jgi:acyl-coenzyme A thioesterase PaaI-like protein
MVKEGKRIGVVEVEVYNDTEKLLAKGTFTYYFLEQDIC